MNDEQVGHVVQHVRKTNPLIHHLINDVVINFTANGLLAFGGSPIMAKELEEVDDISKIADGLLINIGTMLKKDLDVMLKAGKEANKRQIPVVLDPVGVASSTFRNRVVEDLFHSVSFTAIKGNAGEMAHLVNIPWVTKGVDSIDDSVDQLIHIGKKVSKTYNTIAIITGEKDIICYKNNLFINETGHYYLTKVTGTGCLLGSLITACLTVNLPIPAIEKVWAAVYFYGYVAQNIVKERNIDGPGTFSMHFIDGLNSTQINV